MVMKKTTIAVITCYHDPDYVRARALRSAIEAQPKVNMLVIKNKHKGARRYLEVLWQVIKTKLRDKPQAFLLTFRGQEILPLILLIAGRTPVWFDEFVVPSAYVSTEKHRKTLKKRLISLVFKLTDPIYRVSLRRCQVIFSDTPSHAELGAKLSRVNLSKYFPVPVGTDEKLFKPRKTEPKSDENFTVFYYTTNMQPLHGIPHVLEAAERLAGDRRIHFTLVGGKKPFEKAVEQSIKRGARITYEPWVAFDSLPKYMRESSVTLGGPFGGTPQAMHVITGKTFQSLACAVPTIIGDNPDTAHYFTDKSNALVIKQQSADALIEAINWAVDNPKELGHIAQKGRATYEKHFSTIALADRLKTVVDVVRIDKS